MSAPARRAAALALLLAGCIGGPPPPPRYFSPPLPVRPARATPAALEGVTLRLLPVAAAELLRDRIVWRRSDVELGFYEQERWTEPPARTFERALARELFEVRGLVRGGRSASHELAVELVACEEVLLPEHRARVVATVALLGADQTALLERTFAAEEPIAAEDAQAMARAVGAALDRVVLDAADALEARLRR